jgi:hypothetical protein
MPGPGHATGRQIFLAKRFGHGNFLIKPDQALQDYLQFCQLARGDLVNTRRIPASNGHFLYQHGPTGPHRTPSCERFRSAQRRDPIVQFSPGPTLPTRVRDSGPWPVLADPQDAHGPRRGQHQAGSEEI